MENQTVILVAHPNGIKFFDKHYNLNVYLVNNVNNRLLLKTESINYLPRTIKLTFPQAYNPDDEPTDRPLFHIYAQLVNLIDNTEKKMESRNVPYTSFHFGRLFVLNIYELTSATPTTLNDTTTEKNKEKKINDDCS